MTRPFQASTPVTIDDTMTARQHHGKHETLTYSHHHDTIQQGDQNARYGKANNRILDREAGRRDAGDAVQHSSRLDQGWHVSSVPAWRTLASQEKRAGGLAGKTKEQVSALGNIPKNAGGPLFLRTISGP